MVRNPIKQIKSEEGKFLNNFVCQNQTYSLIIIPTFLEWLQKTFTSQETIKQLLGKIYSM